MTPDEATDGARRALYLVTRRYRASRLLPRALAALGLPTEVPVDVPDEPAPTGPPDVFLLLATEADGRRHWHAEGLLYSQDAAHALARTCNVDARRHDEGTTYRVVRLAYAELDLPESEPT